MAVVTPERATPTLPVDDLDEDDRIGGSGYIVIVYDNDKNTWDEVVMILQKATGCTQEEAENRNVGSGQSWQIGGASRRAGGLREGGGHYSRDWHPRGSGGRIKGIRRWFARR